jgi:hypothetical protein
MKTTNLMSTDNPLELAPGGTLPLDEPRASPSAAESRDVESLSALLSRTFHNAPNVVYMLPNDQTRRAAVSWFFRSVAIPACRLYGEIYTTPSMSAAALWLKPNHHPSGLDRILRGAMRKSPLELGRTEIRRWMRVSGRMEAVHRWLARGPHWYLVALGAESSMGRKTIREVLIEPVLSRAHSDGVPCHVDTFDETTLCFYEACGFRVSGAGRIPGGPMFWSMVRA